MNVFIDGVQYVPVGGQPPVVDPVPPVHPTDPIPPVVPGSGTDLSDKVEHTLTFQSGVPQNVFCRVAPQGGYVEISGVAVAGTTAVDVYASVNGGPNTKFTPSGTDFRFKAPESTYYPPGTSVVQSTITIEGINGGVGRFSLQAVGAVGP